MFDLESDPDEEHNLASDPLYVDVVRDYEAAMRAMIDPEEIDRQANAAQKEMIEKAGGLEQVFANLVTIQSYTPVPDKMFEDRVVLLTHARHFVETCAPDYWGDTERPSSVTAKNLRMLRNETRSRMSSPVPSLLQSKSRKTWSVPR